MTMFDDVGSFHGKFGLDYSPPALFHKTSIQEGQTPEPHVELPNEIRAFRLNFLEEELDELREGYEEENLEKVADALIDLIYVALGTAHLHHLPFDAMWQEVHNANMQKRRALIAGDSKRGSVFDVVKPEGWKPPNHKAILRQYERKIK